MRKIWAILLFVAFASYVNAQTEIKPTVEKSVTGAQIGLFGLDVYNESRLADQVALRSNVGFLSFIWREFDYPKTGFVLYPVITLQPKYYYNIAKRSDKGKNAKNNSANYLALQVRYVPDWFVITNFDQRIKVNSISFIPTFGIRRNFAGNFNYEFKFGVGYGSYVMNKTEFTGVATDFSLKVGYDF